MISTRCPAGQRTNVRGASHALLPGLQLEARVAQRGERPLVVRSVHGDVPLVGHDRIVDRHQVDLGALPRDPDEAVAQERWRDHRLEAEQAPEAHARVGPVASDLERDVLEHR